MEIRIFLALVMCFLATSGCATFFTGSPRIDRPTCEKKCSEMNMELTSMVIMGEYSEGCVCRIKNQSKASNDDSDAGSAGIAAAGVMLQMQRQAEKSTHP